MDVYKNEYITNNIDFMEATAKENEIEKYTLKKDDVIITKDSETPDDIAVPTLVKEKLNNVLCGYHLSLIRTNKNKLIGSFLSKYLTLKPIRHYFFTLANGVTRFGLNIDSIKNAIINKPKSLHEQTHIAEILTTWDTAIEKQEKLIKLKKEQKKGLMQLLLTGKKRFKEFSDEWKEVKIKDIFNVTRGYVLAVSKMKQDISEQFIYPVYSSQTKNNGLTGYFNEFLYENAITWTTDGANAGDVKYRNGKFYCTNVCGVLLSKDGYANQCIAEMLNRITHKYVSYVGNPKLMNNVMSEIKISLPSLPEQKKIASVLSSADKEIELLEKELEEMKLQKKGLMQLLLSGIVRVN
jgi:type I restriction enzyme S subunit